MKTEKVRVKKIIGSVDKDAVRIALPGGATAKVDTHRLYTSIKELYAKEDIIAYLLDAGYDEDVVLAAVDEDFTRRWLNAVANNETIAECKSLAAQELAEEYGLKLRPKGPLMDLPELSKYQKDELTAKQVDEIARNFIIVLDNSALLPSRMSFQGGDVITKLEPSLRRKMATAYVTVSTFYQVINCCKEEDKEASARIEYLLNNGDLRLFNGSVEELLDKYPDKAIAVIGENLLLGKTVVASSPMHLYFYPWVNGLMPHPATVTKLRILCGKAGESHEA